MKTCKTPIRALALFHLALGALFVTAVPAQQRISDLPPGLIQYADTVVTNGKIVTMDNTDILASDPGTIVEAMALRDGKVLALGSNREILRYAGPDTRDLDVRGKTVIPGLIETHVHPESTLNEMESVQAVRDAYQVAEGLHTAVQIQQDPASTLAELQQILADHPPRPGEWIHVRLIPNEDTDWPDIGALTDGLYNDIITRASLSRTIPDNPASLGSGDGPGAVLQPGLVVRITVGPDRKSEATVVGRPGTAGNDVAAAGNPFDPSIFKQNAAADQAEAMHAHRNCGVAGDTVHHGWHCSHRAILLNQVAYDITIDEWPGFVKAANETMSLTENSGDRGILAGVFRNAWTREVMFPPRTPRELYRGWMKDVMQHYAEGGLTMIASSIEEGRTVTAFYDLIREEGKLPIRFGYGYEMFRSPLLYPSQPQLVRQIGAHRSSIAASPYFWVMGITDGGAGDARRIACFAEDLSGPDNLKDRELCMNESAYRIERTLVPAIKAGWRAFSLHAFGSNQFRLHAGWIERARREAGMSMQDIRDLRLAFAHGGAVGKVPDVMETMREYNFYVPIRPSDVAESMVQVKRYGPEGLEFLAPTKTLLEAGVKVVGEGGHSLDPHIYFRDIAMFVTRRIKDPEDADAAGELVMPEETVSRATGLRLYTSRAAEWLFAEDHAGTLEPGKFADFLVLDRDYFSIPTAEIGDNTVLMTVVGDSIEYQDPEWRPAGMPASSVSSR